jgi:glycosyltransferase involved in cell wall biosynthesis
MVSLSFFTLSFLSARVLISFINFITRNKLKAGIPAGNPLLSVLIPARNEETSLPLLLDDLGDLTFGNVEIIVCDDHSTDHTADILKARSGQHPNLTWFKGADLPEGWLGKNYACYQLAQKAKGDYLLFLDADVRVSPDMASNALHYIQKSGRQLVSVFPTQEMRSFGEMVTVPIMNWILLSLLPLPLVRSSANPALSAANGQFMLFEGKNYRENQWHLNVKNESTEDIVISRLIKKKGGKVATLTGNSDVFCRMYHSADEAISGFSRNVNEYFGGSRLIMVLFLLTILFGWYPVWVIWGGDGIILFVMLIIINRILVTLVSEQRRLVIFLHPLQMLSFAAIVSKNIINKARKRTIWKGRTVKI